MHRNNHFCFRGDSLFDEFFVHVHGVGADVNEYGDAAAQNERIDGGNERVARHDELVAGLDIAQDRGHFQCGCAGMSQQDFLRMKMLFEPVIALFGEIAVSGELSQLYGLCNVPEFLADDVGFVERNV